MLRGQRSEIVEQRIDGHRSNENKEQDDRQRRRPRPQPPAMLAPTDEAKDHRGEKRTQNYAEKFAFGPVPQPGSPALYRLLVLQFEMLQVGVQRQHRDIEEENENRWKD